MAKGERMRSSGTTLRAIAEEVGVSTAAVSKVLHGRGGTVRVSSATASAIREVATRLRYTPNALARSLRTNRTYTVGLVFENFGEIAAGPLYYVHLLDGVASVLFPRHYRLSILSEMDQTTAAETVRDGRLDGPVWCKMPEDPSIIQAIQTGHIPCVALNAPPPREDPGMVYICCENEEGAALVADHLAMLGHRKLGFVLEKGEEETPDARARLRGFSERVQSLGLEQPETLLFSTHASEFEAWWRSDTGVTALFAWNERLASEILMRAATSGVDVPRELSVVGFDSTKFCETTVPRLTAVSQPIKEMAQEATRTLLDLIEGVSPSVPSRRFPCVLDVRESTSLPYNKGVAAISST